MEGETTSRPSQEFFSGNGLGSALAHEQVPALFYREGSRWSYSGRFSKSTTPWKNSSNAYIVCTDRKLAFLPKAPPESSIPEVPSYLPWPFVWVTVLFFLSLDTETDTQFKKQRPKNLIPLNFPTNHVLFLPTTGLSGIKGIVVDGRLSNRM